MNNQLVRFFAIFLFAGGMFLASCGEDGVTDACADITCPANSECFLGDCICNNGFEKDSLGNCVCPDGFAVDSTGNCVDACTIVDCGVNATCDTGTCICDFGYTFDADGACTVEIREAAYGNYNVDEICIEYFNGTTGNTFNASFGMEIVASSMDITKVVMLDFANSTNSVVATFVTSDSLTIDEGQEVTVDGLAFLVVDGTAKITDAEINMDYNLANPDNGEIEYLCNALAEKQ